MNEQELIERFKAAGQGHIFQHLDQLTPSERTFLFEQAASIDLAELDSLVENYVKNEPEVGVDFETISPAPFIAHPSRDDSQSVDWIKAKEMGEHALKMGNVAAFTVAGGQGTRLGYEGPKGTFPVSPVQELTLFEVFARKIAFAERNYGAPIYWFIMTSIVNHDETVAFFKKHDYFGLEHHRVQFFKQGMMPAVDFDGKLILEDKGRLVMTPDGHGGSLRALNRSGSIQLMEELGITVISYFQVDNPLVKCIDPEFIGFHLMHTSEMSSKMVPKTYPLEKVGMFCEQDEKILVIEYSDLPESYQEMREESGDLKFLSGSIAIHILDVHFVKRLDSATSKVKMPFHKAVKKIPALDPSTGSIVKPESPNGVKFEMFVFDAIPFAGNPIVVETLRSEDFSPVKNAEGKDSPATARADQLKLFANWLKAVGVTVPVDAEGVPEFAFEVDPSFAVDTASFRSAWKRLAEKPEIKAGTVLKG
jgi:UDP-N-acetylglucosamine/UDP-N-acetylgalactosamine diphosphorylase